MKKYICLLVFFSVVFISCEKENVWDKVYKDNSNMITRSQVGGSGLDNIQVNVEEGGGEINDVNYSFTCQEEIVPAHVLAPVFADSIPFKFHVTGKLFRRNMNGMYNYGITNITVECYNHETDFNPNICKFMGCSTTNAEFDSTNLTNTILVEYAVFQLPLLHNNNGLAVPGTLYGESKIITHSVNL